MEQGTDGPLEALLARKRQLDKAYHGGAEPLASDGE